jgi:hypothetical protein
MLLALVGGRARGNETGKEGHVVLLAFGGVREHEVRWGSRGTLLRTRGQRNLCERRLFYTEDDVWIGLFEGRDDGSTRLKSKC